MGKKSASSIFRASSSGLSNARNNLKGADPCDADMIVPVDTSNKRILITPGGNSRRLRSLKEVKQLTSKINTILSPKATGLSMSVCSDAEGAHPTDADMILPVDSSNKRINFLSTLITPGGRRLRSLKEVKQLTSIIDTILSPKTAGLSNNNCGSVKKELFASNKTSMAVCSDAEGAHPTDVADMIVPWILAINISKFLHSSPSAATRDASFPCSGNRNQPS